MKFTFENKIYVGFGLALSLLIATGVFSYYSITGNINTARLFAHSREVIERTEGLFSLLQDAETGTRGYVITGDKSFLAPYLKVKESIPLDYAYLKRLTADNPNQQRYLNQLEPLIQKKLVISAKLINLMINQGKEAATQAVKGGEGKSTMDEIRSILNKMLSDKKQLLQQRGILLEKSNRQTISMIVVGSALAVVFICAPILIINREIKERRRKETELRRAYHEVNDGAKKLEIRNKEIELLSKMAEYLQTTFADEEAFQIISAYLGKLFPDSPGVIYLYNNSRTTLTPNIKWGALSLTDAPFTADDCWALRLGYTHEVHDSRQWLACPHIKQPPPFSYFCIPMLAHGEALGVLHLQHESHDTDQLEQFQAYNHTSQLAMTVTEHIALALSNLYLRQKLHQMSIRDPLTDLYNRRYLEETMTREMFRASRDNSPIGIIMLDIDNFKQYNDTHGHEAGDVVLKTLANLLKSFIRGSDIACRYGGEEFLLAIMGTSKEDTQQHAGNLLKSVQKQQIYYHDRQISGITISVGLSVFPEHGTVINELVNAADKALYRAKAEGRNRVIVSSDVKSATV